MSAEADDLAGLEAQCAQIVRRVSALEVDEKLYGGALLYLCAYFDLRHRHPSTPREDSPQLRRENEGLRAQLAEIVGAASVGKGGKGGRGKPRRGFPTDAEKRAYDLGYATGWHRGRRERLAGQEGER